MLGFELVILLSLLSIAWAAEVNITVDDRVGSDGILAPQFFPPERWMTEDCSTCWIKPDPARAHGGTWRDTTASPGDPTLSFTLNFEGVAVYIYFILANRNPRGADTDTACTFFVDGEEESTFYHTPDMSRTDLLYDQLAFSKTGLSPTGTHRLVGEIPKDQEDGWWVTFDYAIVTVEEPDPEESTEESQDEDSTRPPPSNTTPTSSGTGPSSSITSSSSPATSLSSSSAIDTRLPSSGSGLASSETSLPPSNTNDSSSDRSQPSSDDSPPGTSSATTIGAIVGSILGVIILLGLFLLWLRRRRRLRSSAPHADFSSHLPIMSHADSSTITLPGLTPFLLPYASGGSGSPGPSSTYSPPSTHHASSSVDAVSRYNLTSSPLELTGPRGEPTTIAGPSSPSSDGSSLSRRRTLRDARQRELENQVASARQELSAAEGASAEPLPTPGAKLREVQHITENNNLRNQVTHLQERIRQLETVQSSPWAQGDSDEPPPGYTPSPQYS